ncbi:hypothetical protein Tco_0359493 [Tanacetum coccineum]
MSKLDRFLVSESVISGSPNIKAVTLERFLSDHRPILLKENGYDYGPTPFRFFHHWLEMDGFNTFVENTWKNSPMVGNNALLSLMNKLRNLKNQIRIWNKSNSGTRKNDQLRLKKQLEEIDLDIDRGLGNEELVNSRLAILHQIQKIDNLESKERAQKAKIKWAVEGDENSGFFHDLLLFNWLQGKDACLDVTGISPFAGMRATSWAPRVSLHNAVDKNKRKYTEGASDYTTKRMEQDYELEDMFCSDGVIILNNYVLSSGRWNIIRDSFTEDLKMENMIAKSNHEITYSDKHVSLFEAADAVQKAELLKPLVVVTGETEIKDDDAYKEELLDYEERDEKAPYSAAMSANGLKNSPSSLTAWKKEVELATAGKLNSRCTRGPQ